MEGCGQIALVKVKYTLQSGKLLVTGKMGTSSMVQNRCEYVKTI
jgi:hypothetical protein